jgi:hypothetical protein
MTPAKFVLYNIKKPLLEEVVFILNTILAVRNAVSQVLCFPYCNRQPALYRKRQSFDYRQCVDPPLWFLISSGWCPYLNLGCSLAGFTSFHFLCFQRNSVTVALSGYSWHICRNRLSRFSPPSTSNLAALPCGRHEHSRHPSLGEPGLSSTSYF